MLTVDIDMIDLKTQEIRLADEDTYTDMQSVADELPDSSPRFILLSYPMTLVCIGDARSNISFAHHLSFLHPHS